MKCPFCSSKDTKVIDTRENTSKNSVRRRRECIKCGERFTTYEQIQNDFWVIKRSGKKERYERKKLKSGILKACKKRDIQKEEIDKIIDEVEKEIKTKFPTPIKTSKIGDTVLKKLKALDEIAYLRFSSVYQDFEDISSFSEEVKNLLKEKGGS